MLEQAEKKKLGQNSGLEFSAAPEPATYGLAGVAVLAAAIIVRRRHAVRT
jgi:hypothetical protein